MLAVRLFLLSLVVPIEFSLEVFTLRFTLNRLILILLLPYLLVTLRWSILRKYDYYIILFCSLIMLSVTINSGASGLQLSGITAIETLTPYLLAKKYITDEQKFSIIIKLMSSIIILLAIIGITESFIGIHYIHTISSSLTGYSYHLVYEERIGLTRAYSTFEHPILFGTFCASFLSLAWFTLYRKRIRVMAIVIGTFSSLSSAPLLVLNLQIFFIIWDYLAKRFKNKWNILYYATGFCYLFISIFSNRTPFIVITSYITFNPATAYYRKLIWDYGIINILNNPIFGLGYNDWERIHWMVSATIDNFWLLIAMRHGILTLLVLLSAIFLIIFDIKKAMTMASSKYLNNLRLAWIFSVVSLMIAGCTVAFWAIIYVYFFFFLGAGVWMTKTYHHGNINE